MSKTLLLDSRFDECTIEELEEFIVDLETLLRIRIKKESDSLVR